MFNLIQFNLIENRQEESWTWLSFPLPPVSPICKLSLSHSICRHLPSPVEATSVILFLNSSPPLPPTLLPLSSLGLPSSGELPLSHSTGNPGGLDGKEFASNAGASGLIPESGRSPGEGMVTPSSILAWRILWTRGARQATVHGVTKGQTGLKN